VWLVLLLAALLPVRAWAVASMPVPSAGTLTAPAVAAMPCHGDVHAAGAPDTAVPVPMATGGHAHTDGHSGAGPDSASGHSCVSCVLCHSPIAAEALPVLASPCPSTGMLVPALARDTGRLIVETLERPPRG
jgi:hypothetical protein